MEILFLLIPLSVILVFAIIWALWWAVHRGQFERMENEGSSIFDDEER